jgi:hypothetical protein
MHSLIERLMKKRGINNPQELQLEEKKTFDEWQLILNKEQLETDDIVAFIRAQIGVIENKWKDLDVPTAKKADLIPYHVVYKTLLAAIESPSHARKALEIQINQLLAQ